MPEDTPPPAPQKKRRWRKVLLIIFLVIAVLGFLLNGIGTRYIAHKVIVGQMEKLGATGDFTVEGSLASGLLLKNADFSGSGAIQTLSFDSLGARYTLPGLLKKRLNLLEAKGLTAVVDIAKLPKSKPEEKKPSTKSIAETVRGIQALYAPIKVDIKDLDITILQDGKRLAKVDLDALDHFPDSATTEITGLQVATDATAKPQSTPVQDSALTWTQDGISLDSLVLLPDVAIRDFSLETPASNTLDATGLIRLPDGSLRISSPSPTTATVSLAEGALDLEKITALTGKDLHIAGIVDEVALDFSNLDQPIHDITGTAHIGASSVKYRFASFKKVALDARLANQQIDLVTTITAREKPLELKLSIPISGLEKLDDLSPLNGREAVVLLSVPSIQEAAIAGQGLAGKEAQSSDFPDGSVDLEVVATLDLKNGISSAVADYTISQLTLSDQKLPALTGTAHLVDKDLNATLRASANDQQLDLIASYHLERSDYTYSLGGNLPPAEFITTLLREKAQLFLDSPLPLVAQGKGDLQAGRHSSLLAIAPTSLRDTSGTISTFSTSIDAAWPDTVTIDSLSLDNPSGSAFLSADWDGSFVTIDQLQISDSQAPLLSVEGTLPFDRETDSLNTILQSDLPINLRLVADQFRLARLKDIAPIPALDPITGSLDGAFDLKGTVSSPQIDGSITGSDWILSQVENLRPIDFIITTNTVNNVVTVNGSLAEGGEGLATFGGKLPLSITEWATKEKSFNQTALDFFVKVDDLSLQRFKSFAPDIEKLEGVANVDLDIAGTVSNPTFTGSAKVNAERIRFANDAIPDLRDSRLSVTFDQRVIRIQPSTFTGSGGEFQLSGSVELTDSDPIFNISLLATRAMLFRDDSMSIRADATLRLVGPMERASLSGDIALAESLYFQDLELIPFGVPAKSVPEPNVPRVDSAPTSSRLPIPEPFGNWPLNVSLSTKDPLLIRGNLAQGEVQAKGTIRGVLSNPEVTLDGVLKEANVELPLSSMSLEKSTFAIRPKDNFIPTLNVRGESKVGNHRIFLYVYGKATSPTLVFTSNPPLPESEILTLLASGTTSSDLEDGNVASMKAFQLLVSELRRKYSASQGNQDGPLTPVFDTLDKIDLKSGQNDPFSGRRFNSATVQITDRVFAQAAFDKEGNSRGIVIYSLRF